MSLLFDIRSETEVKRFALEQGIIESPGDAALLVPTEPIDSFTEFVVQGVLTCFQCGGMVQFQKDVTWDMMAMADPTVQCPKCGAIASFGEWETTVEGKKSLLIFATPFSSSEACVMRDVALSIQNVQKKAAR